MHTETREDTKRAKSSTDDEEEEEEDDDDEEGGLRRLLDDGGEESVPGTDLRVGDRVVVELTKADEVTRTVEFREV